VCSRVSHPATQASSNASCDAAEPPAALRRSPRCGVVETELAGFLGELVQDSPTLRAAAVLEVDEVLETGSAVAVRLLEGDGAVFG